VDVGLLIQIYN